MSEQVRLGVLAVLLGGIAITLLLVPYVAISYRRRGGLPPGRTLWVASAVVYFFAVWTYTLLPLPDPQALTCSGTNLRPGAFVDDLGDAWRSADGHPLSAITDPLVLQLLLNVLLFIPLGIFVRVLGRRGVLVAAICGLGLSAFIEATQYTGVWGLYPCAYRVLDVDDLIMNTAGAVIGSLVALAFSRWLRVGEPADDAQPAPKVTTSRRLLGMVCDLVAFTLVSVAVTVTIRAFLLYVLDDRQAALDDRYASGAGLGVALVAWLVVTTTTGKTIGDLAVQVRYAGDVLPLPISRVLRYLGGIGGYGLLSLLGSGLSAVAWLFGLVSVVLTLCTRNGRGLPGLISHQTPVEDHRDDAAHRVTAARP